ncbi:hypothetical protein HK097_004893, partial [Rhizophlyctis rosea]
MADAPNGAGSTSAPGPEWEIGNAFTHLDGELGIPAQEPAKDSTRFFNMILQMCSQGFSSLPRPHQTPSTKRAMLACQLGLDCIAALETGDPEAEAVYTRVRKLSAAPFTPESSPTPHPPTPPPNRTHTHPNPPLPKRPTLPPTHP